MDVVFMIKFIILDVQKIWHFGYCIAEKRQNEKKNINFKLVEE